MLSVSVIIPTRDTRELTMRCIASVEGSTHAAAEILLVDDGSRDGTAGAVRAAFPRVRVISIADTHGFTAAVNCGWPLAIGDIVLLLNSDTEVAPDAIAAMVAAFERSATLGVAGASLRHPDGRAQWSAGREPTALWLFALASGSAAALGRLPGWRLARPESQSRSSNDVAWVPATAMAIRRDVSAQIGMFDPAFEMYAQDLDYCVRARAAGWRVAQVTDAHVIHTLGATIAATPGAVATTRQDPRALFTDLARWIHKTYAPEHARTQARLLCRSLDVGCLARIVARQVGRWCVRRRDRPAWDRDTERYRAARAALRSIASR
jgi:N-acetylglucosaminyl-diphospho-decaprenol L-rhamnosyltransferase